MKTLIEYIQDLYHYSRRAFILNLALMILDGFTSGIGIVMLVPLLSMAGIASQGGGASWMGALVRMTGQYGETMMLIIVLLVYLSLMVAQAFIGRSLSILNSEIVQGYTKHLRVSLYKCVIEAEWTCFKGKKRSDIANAFISEISRVAAGTVNFLRIGSQIIVTVFQLYVAFLMSVPMTLFVLICGAAIFWYMNTTFKASRQLGGSLRHINQEFTGRVLEQLDSIKESKSYGIEEAQLARFESIAGKAKKNLNDFTRMQSRTTMIYKIGAAIAVSLLFFISVVYLKIDVTALIVIVYIFARLWPSFSTFQGNFQNVLAMLPSYAALKETMKDLRAHIEKIEPASDLPRDRLRPSSVRFVDVCFRYGDADGFALENVSFEIPVKTMTALVGKSGAGKSTIVDLLLGLLKPNSGVIMADGRVVDGKLLRAWRREIGYVPQDPFLFNGTIRENLLMFNPGASAEDMDEALQLSAATEFVRKLPEGLGTIIGDSGVRLSGGERQRIVLARALLRKPALLVLDEATSSLDGENECKIQKAIETLSDKIAVVVIAHRLSTIRNADTIIVLDDGKIVEQGSYAELSRRDGGFFRKMRVKSGGMSGEEQNDHRKGE